MDVQHAAVETSSDRNQPLPQPKLNRQFLGLSVLLWNSFRFAVAVLPRMCSILFAQLFRIKDIEVAVLCSIGQDLNSYLFLVVPEEEQPLRAIRRAVWRRHMKVQTTMSDDVSDLLLANTTPSTSGLPGTCPRGGPRLELGSRPDARSQIPPALLRICLSSSEHLLTVAGRRPEADGWGRLYSSTQRRRDESRRYT